MKRALALIAFLQTSTLSLSYNRPARSQHVPESRRKKAVEIMTPYGTELNNVSACHKFVQESIATRCKVIKVV